MVKRLNYLKTPKRLILTIRARTRSVVLLKGGPTNEGEPN
nr:MAG TPA: hypothetical protein [Caudoviricetes sp.]